MPNNRTAPTLDDVAQAAGVSTATVSRCLNAPEKVMEPTRKRVMEAVDALGYAPNFAAQVMAAKRTFTIGAIIPTMENAIFARGLQAFQEELGQLGYNLLVSSSAYDPDVEKEQIRSLVARGADGLLLIGHDRDASVYEFLENRGIPALAAWSFDETARIPSIGFNNRSAMHALTDEVIGLGHTNIAMISGITRGNDRARLRLAGLMDSIIAHGLDPQNVRVVQTHYGIENGGTALEELVSLSPQVSAVLCGNDVLAVGALKRASAMGLRIPEDISITGFDDIELAGIVNPPLTTVHVPHRRMGRKAAQELVDMVERKSSGRSIKLSTLITHRSSLGRHEEKRLAPDA